MQGGYGFGKQAGELVHRGVENCGHILAVPPHAGGDRHIIAFYMIKHQCFAAVQLRADTPQFVNSVHRSCHMGQPACILHFLQAIF